MPDAHKLVKDVFFMIMGVTLAMLLYWFFFGVGSWDGALWWSAEAVEVPISNYYYNYCFLPNIRSSDYMDEALGGSIEVTDIFETNANLEDSDSDYVNFGGTSFEYYSTGWK